MPKKCCIEGCTETKIFTHGHCYKHRNLYYNSKPKVKKEKPKYFNDELELAKIKRKKSQHIGKRCQISGVYSNNLHLTHIIRRSYSSKLKLDERNIILADGEFHTMFDDGKGWYLLQYFPWRFKAILIRMKNLDELYFNRYCGSNGINSSCV